ncbi:hypothetical protein [Nocardia tengchongensis]
MAEENSQLTSLVGPVRYHLFVQIIRADGTRDEEDEDPIFTVNGLALPRVGDELCFEGHGMALQMIVREVGHHFYEEHAYTPPHRVIQVVADAIPFHHETVRKLRDPVVLERWIAHFTMLEPDVS